MLSELKTQQRDLYIYPDQPSVKTAIAERLVQSLRTAQQERGQAHVCLTGGRVGTASLAALFQSSCLDLVDWSNIDIWWSDEAFLQAESPQRHATQAEAVLLDLLPLNPDQLHPMPTLGIDEELTEASIQQAAQLYEQELASYADVGQAMPTMDVSLLGLGAHGHIASLFPGHASLKSTALVTYDLHSPVPPTARLSLTLRALNTAREIWVAATSSEKASAVRELLSPETTSDFPAAAIAGMERTILFTDEAGASELSEDTRALALPH